MLKINPKYPAKCPQCGGENTAIALFTSFVYTDCVKCTPSENKQQQQKVYIEQLDKWVELPVGYMVKTEGNIVLNYDMAYSYIAKQWQIITNVWWNNIDVTDYPCKDYVIITPIK